MKLFPLSLVLSAFLTAPVIVGCQGDDNTLPTPPDSGSADAKSADATTPPGDGATGDAAKDAPTGDGESTVDAGADGSKADGSAEQEAGPDGSEPDAAPLDGSQLDAQQDATGE